MTIYYVIVAGVAASLAAFFQKDRRIDVIVLYAIGGIVWLLAGLRMNAEIDYLGYAEMFDDTPKLADFNAFSASTLYGENGYLLFNSVIKSLGGSVHAVMFICASLAIWIKVYVLKKLALFRSLSFSLFLCLHFITIEFIQMRWAVACAFIALGLYFLNDRKIGRAIICLTIATGFHYYSLLFIAIGAAALYNGYWRYYVFLAISAAWALLFRGDVLQLFVVDQSEVYVIKRYASYVADPQSRLGVFSFIKLAVCPAIYTLCHAVNSRFCKTDRYNLFLFRVSFAAISLTLMVSSVPMFHYRAVVIADFFSIMLALNATYYTLAGPFRILIATFLALGYSAWYILDVANYENAGRLFTYSTWL